MKYWIYGLGGLSLVLVATLSVFALVAKEHFHNLKDLQVQSDQNKSTLLNEKQKLFDQVLALRAELDISEDEARELARDLRDEKRKFDNLEDEVSDALGTVGNLQKLQTLDEELLFKYSSALFLNEHYVPENLSTIDRVYDLNQAREYEIRAEVLPFLEDLLEDAADDNLNLRIISAYRSFETQEALKNQYVVNFGQTAANQFSADQGFSEHQLGTTIDFTTPEIGSSLSQFKNTAEYEWLTERAHRYGFTLSYPEGNSFFVPEPWHWRFVGEDLARDLKRDDKYFYDLDQREIDTYLLEIFED